MNDIDRQRCSAYALHRPASAFCRTRIPLLFAACLIFSCAQRAAAFDIAGPPGSVSFGTTVAVLPNGNIVVVDPDGPATDVGSAYLYDPDGNLISTLTGSQAGDHVGSSGIVVLATGDYVIVSPQWNANAGAVTWGSATAGVTGVVSASNSLVGSSAVDSVGSSGVTPLGNGDYVVASPSWNSSLGAATWSPGDGSRVGPVSAGNSLVGSTAGDGVGRSIVTLGNGNYVVDSYTWHYGSAGSAGAVTWCNGAIGRTGVVSASNSLVGSTADDNVGEFGIVALSNGNYVVGNPVWDDGGVVDAGAATWGDGSIGTAGPVSEANSLFGSTGHDNVGATVTALSNGNYVIASTHWDNSAAVDAGAVTWGDGSSGTTGAVSSSNSLVGGTSGDGVGFIVTPLSNGNYVVAAPNWYNGNASATNAGAATWGNGNGGTVGAVSTSNSLVGSATNDQVGSQGVVALSNGNYVVSSPYWNNVSVSQAGAATWSSGANGGLVGTVSTGNSLVGSSASDNVGIFAIALSNGNYAISSPFWRNGATSSAGAVTWGDGAVGSVGTVAAGNSLIGERDNDLVGYRLIALANGRYAAGSPLWTSSTAASAGAIVSETGRGVHAGILSTEDSLVGTSANDQVGGDLAALDNGSYIVKSRYWDNGAIADAGAITLRRGNDIASGVTADNSVRGEAAGGGASMVYSYDPVRDTLVVGRPMENIVTVFKADLLFRDGFE